MIDASQSPDRARMIWASARTLLSNVLLSVLFVFFAMAAFSTWRETGNLQMLLVAAQEALIVGLIVTRRRSIEVSQSWWDAAIALVGTAMPLLQRPGGPQVAALSSVGLGIQLVGAALALAATFSLGRSFGIIAANRGVQTGGLYRLVRHPLYGSYLIGYIGFLLGNLSPLNIAIIAGTFLCQYLRARAEEKVLLRDPSYAAYAATVRYRFIPFVL
jgi:protein-S-isoprenylcysteine O-methyltransferase Ste14